MTSTEQRPKPFDGRKQDHGDAGERLGRWEKFYREESWPPRDWGMHDAVIADRAHLKNTIASGVDDYLNVLSPAELEEEANRILAESESDDYADDFEGRSADEDRDYIGEVGLSQTERIQTLQGDLKELKAQLARLPVYSQEATNNNSWFQMIDQQRLDLEGSIDEVITEIKELLGESDYPEAALGVASRADIRNRMARVATLDDYSDDDLSDDTEVGARVHRVR